MLITKYWKGKKAIKDIWLVPPLWFSKFTWSALQFCNCSPGNMAKKYGQDSKEWYSCSIPLKNKKNQLRPLSIYIRGLVITISDHKIYIHMELKRELNQAALEDSTNCSYGKQDFPLLPITSLLPLIHVKQDFSLLPINSLLPWGWKGDQYQLCTAGSQNN